MFINTCMTSLHACGFLDVAASTVVLTCSEDLEKSLKYRHGNLIFFCYTRLLDSTVNEERKV